MSTFLKDVSFQLDLKMLHKKQKYIDIIFAPKAASLIFFFKGNVPV